MRIPSRSRWAGAIGRWTITFLALGIAGGSGLPARSEVLSIAVFQVDATPPIGTALTNGTRIPAKKVVDPLSARGLILLTDQKPIILCAVDWVGIGNGGNLAWRQALAEAAGTTPDRVAVHTVHQHDAPGCDFSAEELLAPRGLGGKLFDAAFARQAIGRAAESVRQAMTHPQRVTHIGLGQAKVERVASNRRILGPDGKVQTTRMSSCVNKKAIAAPEGVIDPVLKLISFWADDRPLASLTYYAVHPQSFYGRGAVSADYVGLARALREATIPDVAHIHFNGAGGNVAAGKYNDGSPARRFELAGRLADAMARAWDAAQKHPITVADVHWKVRPVALPLREGWSEEEFMRTLDDPSAKLTERLRSARNIAWMRRCKQGDTINLCVLELGQARVLHTPGELFVEYQLAAQKMKPEAFVCMASYGDFGSGYIGTAEAYDQGGYETGPVSRVSPQVEAVLMSALADLLK